MLQGANYFILYLDIVTVYLVFNLILRVAGRDPQGRPQRWVYDHHGPALPGPAAPHPTGPGHDRRGVTHRQDPPSGRDQGEGHRCESLKHYFSFQPVLHDWCNKGCGMCYPVCGMVHIKEPLLLIGKSSLCGGSGFP